VEKTPQGTSKIHVLGPRGDPIWAPFFHKKWSFFQCKISSIFFIDFLLDFGSILGGFWRPKFKKKRYQVEKGDFSKMSVSYTRELNFGGSGDPKTIQKASKNGLENQPNF